MEILIAVQGSYGDLNPCVGIALRLRERGHSVVFLTSAYFEPWLKRFGLEMAATLSREDQERITTHPDFTHPMRTFQLLMRESMLGPMRREYEAIRERYRPGHTAVLMVGPGLGARIAHDHLGAPLATLLLYPQLLRSIHDPYGILGGKRTLPTPARRLLHRMFDWRVDATVGPETEAFRRELGLPPVRRGFHKWACSPLSTVALFPEWYAPRQPDWPPLEFAGFPLFDGGEGGGLAPEVEEFLQAGDAPVIVNALSAQQNAREFFEASVEAVRGIRRRAILLSPFPGNVPEGLPKEIRYFGYVPHTLLLPRAAAIIHQGGIGTMAKALLAGIPQIIVPTNFDQPYNGAKMQEMGTGAMVRRRAYRPERVAATLKRLLDWPAVAEQCRQYAAKMRREDGAGKLCDLIERTFPEAPRPSIHISSGAVSGAI
jgi:rhamnosyltransferase subunit B